VGEKKKKAVSTQPKLKAEKQQKNQGGTNRSLETPPPSPNQQRKRETTQSKAKHEGTVGGATHARTTTVGGENGRKSRSREGVNLDEEENGEKAGPGGPLVAGAWGGAGASVDTLTPALPEGE